MTKLTNGEQTEERFYDAAPLEPHLLYQGEILLNVPLMLMPKPNRWQLLRTKTGDLLETLKKGENPATVRVLDSNQTAEVWDNHGDGDFAMARLSKRPVLVVSQTCDVSNKDWIAVAPIHEAGELTAERRAVAREGGMFDVFYLPANPDYNFPESFGDLSQLQAVHKSYIKRLAPGQHFRLTQRNTLLLQQRITRYFGRPNSFDARSDKVPRSGVYMCIGCFYMDGQVSSFELQEGSAFPACANCDGFQWVKRAR